jgi:hypothetical protein
VDSSAALGGPQLEILIQEIIRRIERKQRDDQLARKNAAFDAPGLGRR